MADDILIRCFDRPINPIFERGCHAEESPFHWHFLNFSENFWRTHALVPFWSHPLSSVMPKKQTIYFHVLHPRTIFVFSFNIYLHHRQRLFWTFRTLILVILMPKYTSTLCHTIIFAESVMEASSTMIEFVTAVFYSIVGWCFIAV